MRTTFFILLCFWILITPAFSAVYAPVTELNTIEPLPQSATYRVRNDDTLYSIAWRYGLDYRQLATINHIAKPYHIEIGQLIYLKESTLEESAPKEIASEEKTTNVPVSPVVPQKAVIKQPVRETPEDISEPTANVSLWRWPSNGPLVRTFSSTSKGVDIGGRPGDAVYPAAPGKVVYSGNGLRGYGNLIIIKHNSQYLSAYAYNQSVLVAEGDRVKYGQRIATMGNNSSGKPMLHFEIRRDGKPVNPLGYLAKK